MPPSWPLRRRQLRSEKAALLAAHADEKDALLKEINRLMLQVSKATGVTTTKLAEDMRGAYGVKSSKDLTVDQLREVIASLQEQAQGA